MKEENKKEVKKNVMAGVGTAAGAVIGSVIENTFNPSNAGAEEMAEPEILETLIEEDSDLAGDAILASHETSETVGKIVKTHATTSHHHPSPTTEVPVIETVDDNIVIEETVESVETVEIVGFEDVVSDIEPEIIPAIAEVIDDIEVVNIDPEQNPTSAEDANEPLVSSANEDSEYPDYLGQEDADTKTFGVGDSGIASAEMPDYVNNANIDSFTDPA